MLIVEKLALNGLLGNTPDQEEGNEQVNGSVIKQGEISFTVQPGQILGVAGANGAGKSTLLKLLSGELLATQGQCSWRNHMLQSNADSQHSVSGASNLRNNGLTAKEWAQNRAWLAQRQSVIPGYSVEDIILLGAYPYDLPKDNQQISVHLSELLNVFELSDLRHRDMANLSGGEQQRVHLARIALQLMLQAKPSMQKAMNGGAVNGHSSKNTHHQPKLVLLDEPLSGLDIRHQQRFIRWLHTTAKQQGWAVVLVMHELERLINVCDQLMLLKSGRCIAYGTPEILFSNVITSRPSHGTSHSSSPTNFHQPHANERQANALLSDCFDCELFIEGQCITQFDNRQNNNEGSAATSSIHWSLSDY